ncbi:hypothetical protein COCCADRAFT_86382 [Bipolaris zeicola 26-R-13]|uniref:Uncharacterized protein n=1 Tax=Cochliobolus carbonum (strain 26-R-13) TaxID=930089 RepID=W6YHR7_COCC2|nr:uncharacterized protein COCCADRAFT_86382 [Bipolaris zeicola 26-R-13]EUC37105.1 hypothetical protein COCCADRAFT_86382 [Bipolaris zeicola 26-R-13]
MQFHIRGRVRPAHNSGIQQSSLASFGREVAILMANTPKTKRLHMPYAPVYHPAFDLCAESRQARYNLQITTPRIMTSRKTMPRITGVAFR